MQTPTPDVYGSHQTIMIAGAGRPSCGIGQFVMSAAKIKYFPGTSGLGIPLYVSLPAQEIGNDRGMIFDAPWFVGSYAENLIGAAI